MLSKIAGFCYSELTFSKMSWWWGRQLKVLINPPCLFWHCFFFFDELMYYLTNYHPRGRKFLKWLYWAPSINRFLNDYISNFNWINGYISEVFQWIELTFCILVGNVATDTKLITIKGQEFSEYRQYYRVPVKMAIFATKKHQIRKKII